LFRISIPKINFDVIRYILWTVTVIFPFRDICFHCWQRSPGCVKQICMWHPTVMSNQPLLHWVPCEWIHCTSKRKLWCQTIYSILPRVTIVHQSAHVLYVRRWGLLDSVQWHRSGRVVQSVLASSAVWLVVRQVTRCARVVHAAETHQLHMGQL